MKEANIQLALADRLGTITKAVGLSLWQLQMLESSLAQAYVLMALAKPGMGLDAAKPILDDALAKTFGSSIHKMVKAKLLPEELAQRLLLLLTERNWLVHSSQSDNRNAIHHDAACQRALTRIDAIGDEARELLKEINKFATEFVAGRGITLDHVERLAARTLEEWHRGD